jgi:predicted transcriptional regulator of viral defense system
MYNQKKLQDLGIFRIQDAREAGLSQPTLSRLAHSGQLLRLERGLYQYPGATIDASELDFAIACARLGKNSVIGGISALFRYGLISQVPDQIWILVPPSIRSKNPLYRCLRTQNNLVIGVVDHRIYRITSLERTLIESLQYASKIGVSIAVSGARKALEEGMTSEKKLYDMAIKLGQKNGFIKYWEVIVSP